MYSVVGCRECDALWIVEGHPDTTECRRCGTRYSFDRLEQFVETGDVDAAARARARLLAERSGHEDAFENVDGNAIEDPVVPDEEYLEAYGIDPDQAADAAESERSRTGRRETVLEAVAELAEPTEEDVIEYATARGVNREYVETALSKLVAAGRVTETNGRYRRL